MKRTQLKDSLRTIKRQIVSYISVVVIAMLATSIFLSVSFASTTIKSNGDYYYKESNYRDAELFYNSGAKQEDIDYFSSLEGIRSAEGEYTLTCALSVDGNPVDIDVLSLTHNISTPILLEGELPIANNECLIEEPIATEYSIHIGDQVSFVDTDGNTPNELVYDSYTVTGIIYHANNLAIALYTNNNPCAVIPLDGFDYDARHGLFTSILLSFDCTEGMSRFDNTYLRAVREVETQLNPYIEQRGGIIYSGLFSEYEDTIEAYQVDLDNGLAQLNDSRAQLDDGWAQLADGEAQLDDAQRQLTDSRQQLDDAQTTLEDARIQLDDAQRQLAAGWQELQDNLALLEAAEAQLAPAHTQLEEAQRQLADANAQLQYFAEQINQGQIQLEAARQQLADAESRLNQAQAEIDSHAAEAADLEQQLQDATNTINNNVVPFATNLHTILKSLIGDYADIFDWSQVTTPVDYHDRNSHINRYVLPGDVTIDIAQPLSVNVETLLRTLNLSEETLAAAYSAATGNPPELPVGVSSWHQYISGIAADRVLDVFPSYNTLTDSVSQWETGHDYYIQYTDAVAEVQSGWNQYYSGRTQYNEGLAELNRNIEYFNQKQAEYNAGLAEYNQRLAEYQTARTSLDDGWAQYYAALDRYNAALAEFEANRSAYINGLAEYRSGSEEYEYGLAAYEQNMIEYEESYERLEEGEAEYAEGLAEYEEGLEEFENARALFDENGQSRFLFSDITVNRSFCIIRRTGGNLSDIGRTFTAVFVIIAALVIYATLGRIVDEQRTLIGTNKALGFFNKEVLSKYLLFGLTGTLAGAVVGTVLGYFVILPIVMKGYSHNFVYGAGKYAFVPYLVLAVIIASVILASFTIIFACLTMLTSNAITLLAPPVPHIHKHKGKAKAAKFLYPKLILMNILSDKKRVIATIVSVLGCCTLLAAGFGMQMAIKRSITDQFDKFEHYDYKVKFDIERNPDANEQVLEALNNNGTTYVPFSDFYRATKIGDTTIGIELVCGDLDAIDPFFTLNDNATGEHLDSSLSGIWIHTKLSEYYDVHPGDNVTIYDSRLNPYTVPIVGIYQNNLGFYSFMTPENYVSTFGIEPEYNSYFIFQSEQGPLNLESDINQIEGIKEFKNNIELRDYYLSVASALDALAILLIAMSAMLAYFILLNLVSMLINQKKKELTIMRINGFSLWKTINYVAGELAVCTVIGVILGLICGNGLEMNILHLLESDQIRFDHGIQWTACLYATLITIFFTVLVSAPVFRKIKFLQLTDMTS